jgi:hypothetical protein
LGPIGGNPPMLVEVTHSVQPPKKVLFQGCRTICWLKVSDNCDCVGGNALRSNPESAPRVAIPSFDDGKLNVRVWNGDGQFSQSPHELIKGRPHRIESIPASQANIVGNVGQVNPEDMPLIFKVILTTKSAGIRFMENPKFSVESLKVTLRPIQFQIGVCQSSAKHNAAE